ncbi:MAG: hypothetical protein F6K19_11725 [Cyanothece sp. SIO1E1]|nr:hypothetical protein [Cyanothece sp. SIO1E1]
MPQRCIPYWLALAAAVVGEFVADYITHKPPSAPLAGVRLARTPMLFDNTKAQRELDLTFRPLKESLADAICWYDQSGLLQRQPMKLVQA